MANDDASSPPDATAAAGSRGIGHRPRRPVSAPGEIDQTTPPVDSQAAPATALAVRVVNGNLAYIDEPLFIGHYASMALSGAEAVVDAQIGGTMARALALQAGHYPEALGTHLAFENLQHDPQRPDAPPKPAAVMVVGLGTEGLLTEQGLSRSVRQAVLDWLQRHHERPLAAGRAQPTAAAASDDTAAAPGAVVGQPARIAATLIGSGGIGVSPGASARAIVQAVLEANRRSRRAGWAPVGELRLVELYLDRASEAWRELQLLAEAPPGEAEAFALAPLIEAGSGAKRRPLDSSYRGANYDLVRIFGRGQDTIEYAMDSRRARSEVRTQSTQRGLVRALVREAATHHQTDRRLGNTLFKLLVPPDIEPYLLGQTRLILDMAPAVASLPWEMLDARVPAAQDPQHEPWAVRTGLLRKLQVTVDRPRGQRDSRADDGVLVVGDPRLPAHLASRQLPGALKEAQAVEARLQTVAGIDRRRVVTLLQADVQAITNTLLAHEWRVVHIAGHGEWNGRQGGVLLSQPGTYLGPKEVRAMRAAPELVFINCCHLADLGSADPVQDAQVQQFAPGDLAQGVAAELIKAGVRCVVAAGWAVDDEAACRFAETFYDQLARGRRFGDAVTEARRRTYQHERQRHLQAGGAPDHPIGNTWAAYQCYGDPDWRLVRSDEATTPDTPDAQARYAQVSSAPALVLALESLAIDARWGPQAARSDAAGAARCRAVLADVTALAERFGETMGHIGAVAEAFGLAFDEAGDSGEAIRWYGRATHARDGTASFKALEAWGNLRSRRAFEQAREGGAEQARVWLAEAEAGLQTLHAQSRLRDNDEVHCLVGSAHKRLALIHELAGSPPDVVAACLAAMQAAYETGLARAEAPRGNRLYPLANLVALDVRQALGPDSPRQRQARARLADRFAQLAEALRAPPGHDPQGEWGRLGLIELALKRAIVAADPQAWGQALDDLVQCNRRVPGSKMWRTALDQWQFTLAEVNDPERLTMKDALLTQLTHFAKRA